MISIQELRNDSFCPKNLIKHELMRLYTDCISCKTANTVKSYASTRPDLAMDKGDEFKVNCTNCAKDQNKHVNDVYATENPIILIIGIVISIVVTVYLWSIVGVFGTITIIIPALIWQQQRNAAHAFNSYRIER